MDRCIAERPKSLIWLENSCKQKEKTRIGGRREKWRVEREIERRREQICSLLLSDLFS
jgi:hypothetical protein